MTVDYQSMMDEQHKQAGYKDMDQDFFTSGIFNACKNYTMTSVERLYALYKSVQYIIENNIPGDFVECGVWQGGSCMLMALTLLKYGQCDRNIYLFDTFTGHPKPDEEKDVDIWYRNPLNDWNFYKDSGLGWSEASIEDVTKNMETTLYPMDKIRTVKGMVEDTLLTFRPVGSLALLRLDTDWYSSSKVIMDELYPLVSSNGVVIYDDYGHYLGQREAVDTYFESLGIRPLLNRVDYSCRVMTKNI